MNSLLQKNLPDDLTPSEEHPALNALPTAADYAAAARRRALGFLLGGIVLALIVAVLFAGLGKISLPGLPSGNIFIPLVLLLVFVTPILLWRYPRFVLFFVLASVCLFEPGMLSGPGGGPYADSLTDRVPMFWNVNTIFQRYANLNLKAVPLSLFELILLVAGVCSVLRSVYTSTADIRKGEILLPVSVYLGFVGLGWINGMATGGDFKVSLQEVRSQVYFGLAYLLAVSMIRERRQLLAVFWVAALCIGLKGILLTFRRYVTLQGLPLSDQGAGSHEEAFFFDCFICLLLALLTCGTYSKLRWTMLALLPFVVLGSLACNRRAGTAAFVVIIPLLFLAAYQALPMRRRLIGLIAVVSAILFFGYYTAFKNSDSAIAQPARAIKSQFTPDPRDASSNAYRDAENADLMATIRSAPLGYGYGKRMIHAVPIADISQDYEWWDIMTHNQVLWVWMRVGSIGFLAFWMMISAVLICAARTIRNEYADLELKTTAISAMLITGAVLIFGLLDLQFSNPRDMLFAGMWAGIAAVLPPLIGSAAGSRQVASRQVGISQGGRSV